MRWFLGDLGYQWRGGWELLALDSAISWDFGTITLWSIHVVGWLGLAGRLTV